MKIFYLLLLLLAAHFGYAQADSIRLTPFLVLPKDSLERTALLTSFQEFVSAAQLPAIENPYVLESEKSETLILLDDVAGAGQKGKTDFNFYKPYLINVVPLADSTYYLQLSYIHSSETDAVVRASFSFIGHRKGAGFVFSSPLLYNTRQWKTEKLDNNIFHYQASLNKQQAAALNKLTTLYDAKLKLANSTTDYYCCDGLITAQKLIGIDSKMEYNSLAEGVLSHTTSNRKLVILGDNNADFNHFDPHDLWHDRLSLAIDRSKVNKPVDEGIAYLYGGSWGLGWKEIFKAFKEQVASNKNVDWVALKETPVRFKTGRYNNQADYIINALLVQQIEKQKGFASVWDLLTIGPYEKGNAAYYQTLEKLTGITKETYNARVWELVNAEK